MIFALRSRQAALFVVLACVGCGGGGAALPSSDAAKTALEKSLSAWKNGGKPGTIDGKPAVAVIDTHWQNGQKLDSFEILDDEGGESERTFVVRLSPAAPAVATEVRYKVVGVDPIMVYRDEDYETMLNMGDNKASKPVSKTTRPRGR